MLKFLLTTSIQGMIQNGSIKIILNIEEHCHFQWMVNPIFQNLSLTTFQQDFEDMGLMWKISMAVTIIGFL